MRRNGTVQAYLDILRLIPIGVGGDNSGSSVLLIELEQRLCLGPINEVSRLGRDMRLNGPLDCLQIDAINDDRLGVRRQKNSGFP